MSETLIVDLQTDIKARLEADSYFTDISVFLETAKELEGDIKQVIGALIAKAGKRGATVVVEEPSARDEFANIQSGPLMIDINLLVFEHVSVNRATANGGTGKAGLAICRRIHRILKHYAPGGLANALVPAKPTIVPIAIDSMLAIHRVQFFCQEADSQIDLKVAPVALTNVMGGGGVILGVTMATSTSGASIYYTLDGSHPWSGGATATLYSGQVAVNGGEVFRAAAYRSGWIASNVTTHTVD